MKRLVVAMGAFVACLLVASSAGIASTLANVTISFSGTFTDIFEDSGPITDFRPARPFSGTIDMGPLGLAPTLTPANLSQFSAASVFHLGSISANGQTTITAGKNPDGSGGFSMEFFASDGFNTANNVAYTSLDIFWLFGKSAPSTAGPLNSLTDLPADKAAIIAYLGGLDQFGEGLMTGTASQGRSFSGQFTIDSLSFAVTPVAQTPLPASLPLLVSALGALTWSARASRKRATPATA